jgi:hypothetical protein
MHYLAPVSVGEFSNKQDVAGSDESLQQDFTFPSLI